MKYKELSEEVLRTVYLDKLGATARDGARELGVSVSTFIKALRFHGLISKDGCQGLKPRQSKNPYIQDKEWLRKRYIEDEMSIRQIANEIKSTMGAIHSALTWAKIPIRDVSNGISKRFPEGRTGKIATNWRGGRVETMGYILIWNPDHPYAGRRGYIMEHRLVVEEKIGRYLNQDEVVHHLNGNKKDNWYENLMLTTKGEHTRHHFDDAKRVAVLEKENAELKALLSENGVCV
jgi:hypothetical protein